MPSIGSLARKLLPDYAYARLRALRGDFQYQERLGKLKPPWTAYGLLMAVRAARKYGNGSISVAGFGAACGRGLRYLSERRNLARHVKYFPFVSVQHQRVEPPRSKFLDKYRGKFSTGCTSHLTILRQVGNTAYRLIGQDAFNQVI